MLSFCYVVVWGWDALLVCIVWVTYRWQMAMMTEATLMREKPIMCWSGRWCLCDILLCEFVEWRWETFVRSKVEYAMGYYNTLILYLPVSAMNGWSKAALYWSVVQYLRLKPYLKLFVRAVDVSNIHRGNNKCRNINWPVRILEFP